MDNLSRKNCVKFKNKPSYDKIKSHKEVLNMAKREKISEEN